MASALTTTPFTSSAISRASSDLPLAVGPARRRTVFTRLLPLSPNRHGRAWPGHPRPSACALSTEDSPRRHGDTEKHGDFVHDLCSWSNSVLLRIPPCLVVTRRLRLRGRCADEDVD